MKPIPYNDITAKSIIDLLKAGKERIYAVDQAGISYTLFLKWLKVQPGFNDRVLQSEQEGRLRTKKSLIDIILKAAEKRWQPAAWLLERRYSEEFALKTKSEHSGYIERTETDADRADRKREIKVFLAGLIKSNGGDVPKDLSSGIKKDVKGKGGIGGKVVEDNSISTEGGISPKDTPIQNTIKSVLAADIEKPISEDMGIK